MDVLTVLGDRLDILVEAIGHTLEIVIITCVVWLPDDLSVASSGRCSTSTVAPKSAEIDDSGGWLSHPVVHSRMNLCGL